MIIYILYNNRLFINIHIYYQFFLLFFFLELDEEEELVDDDDSEARFLSLMASIFLGFSPESDSQSLSSGSSSSSESLPSTTPWSLPAADALDCVATTHQVDPDGRGNAKTKSHQCDPR